MKKLKGFAKLSIQIALLSISMIVLSFFTDTEIWEHWFCSEVNGANLESVSFGQKIEGCYYAACSGNKTIHYHWNYRGFVYFFTGLVFFAISVVKIASSHKEEDFINNNK